MVALGILIVLISIVVLFSYRYLRAHYQIFRAKRAAKRADPENPVLPTDIEIPHWSSTADLVTAHFAQLEMLYDPQPPPRTRCTSEGCEHCAFCGRGEDGYEARHGRATRPVVRAHEDCGSDLELPKYTSHPTSSCPRLVIDDEFPPPPTPPPEAHVHVFADGEREGLDLTAAVAAVQEADRQRDLAEQQRRQRERRGDREMERRGSERSTFSASSAASDEMPTTPPPRARRWTFGKGNKPKEVQRHRPSVSLATTTMIMVPL